MKRIVKTIGIIGAIGITIVCAYLLGTTQAEIKTETKEIETKDFKENFVDMRNVVDFTATEYGLQLYLEDGNGYYWER